MSVDLDREYEEWVAHTAAAMEAESAEVSLASTKPSAKKSAKKQSSEPPKRSQATKLVDLALERYDLGVTPDARPFAVAKDVKDGPFVARMIGGKGELRNSLAADYMGRYDAAPSSSALNDALAVLRGQAAQLEPLEVPLRVARLDDNIVIDLGQRDGSVVVVGRDGDWSVQERSPVLFRRTKITSALPIPERGGDLDELRRVLNVSDESWPLAVGYLLSCLVPDVPHPVALLCGEHGTGKSTAAEMLVSLFDPSPAPLRAAPVKVDDWVVGASGSWGVAVDNISTIQPWFSDAICRAATGEGLVKRELFSDDELAVLAFRRCVLLTSIDAGALRGDLADRLVTIELERIPASERRTDAAVRAEFADMHARVFGALLSLLAAVWAEIPNVELDGLPRMADFRVLLEALDRVAGCGSAEVYEGHARQLAADVVEGDPVASAVVRFMENRSEWAGTATELLGLLVKPAELEGRFWPSDGSRLSGRVKRSAPALAEFGLDVSSGRTGQKRTLVLRAVGPVPVLEPVEAEEPF